MLKGIVFALCISLAGASGPARGGSLEWRVQDLYANCKIAYLELFPTSEPLPTDDGIQILQSMAMCDSYLSGFWNGASVGFRELEFDVSEVQFAPADVCVGAHVAMPKLIKIFVDWAESHPEMQTHPAWVGLLTSWRKAWPCENI